MTELRHYICVCDGATFLPIVKEQVLGVHEKYVQKFQQVSINDTIWLYVKAGSPLSRKGAVCGFFKVKENLILPKNGYFSDSNYPFILPLTIDDEIRWEYFADLVDSLNCVTNKKHWGMLFMGRALVEIDDEDSIFLTKTLNSGKGVRI